MKLKIGYFQPVVMFTDFVPPVQFSKIFNLTQDLHSNPGYLDPIESPSHLCGGQKVTIYPNLENKHPHDVTWLIKWIEEVCIAYMEMVTQQSGAEDLKYCVPVVSSIWTIQQQQGQYQEMHSHPGGNISGNIYVDAPQYSDDKLPTDGQLLFRLPQTRDISKFIMADTWKYDPEPGTMTVFPSYIPHTVYPWKGTGTRTVLSFDAVLKPKGE
jgi:hypothetical protein